MTPIRVIRWILVPFAAWLAWAAAVFVGFELDTLANYLCPQNKMVSGMCTADWYSAAFDSIMCFGAAMAAAMAAALTVLLCTLVAPASREQVARATYLVGVIEAVVMGISAARHAPVGVRAHRRRAGLAVVRPTRALAAHDLSSNFPFSARDAPVAPNRTPARRPPRSTHCPQREAAGKSFPMQRRRNRETRDNGR